ncbi:MAG: hypothetical protein AAB353_08080 [Candidatus Hydrogenedentota bacterium]
MTMTNDEHDDEDWFTKNRYSVNIGGNAFTGRLAGVFRAESRRMVFKSIGVALRALDTTGTALTYWGITS